jgi:hypothetical protein
MFGNTVALNFEFPTVVNVDAVFLWKKRCFWPYKSNFVYSVFTSHQKFYTRDVYYE